MPFTYMQSFALQHGDPLLTVHHFFIVVTQSPATQMVVAHCHIFNPVHMELKTYMTITCMDEWMDNFFSNYT